MKKSFVSIVCLLVALLSSVSVMADVARFVVYKVSDDVRITSARGRVLHKNDTVKLTDNVYIPQGKTIVLVDADKSSKMRAFPYLAKEEAQILKVRDIVKAGNNNVINSVVREVVDDSKKVKKSKKKMRIPGGNSRAMVANPFHESLYVSIRAVADSICNKQIISLTDKLSLVPDSEDDLCHFSIENKSNKKYVVNILAINKKTKKVSVCFEFPPYQKEPFLTIDPNTRLKLDDYCFLTDDPDVAFLLIGTEDAWNATLIQQMLWNNGMRVKANPYTKYLTAEP